MYNYDNYTENQPKPGGRVAFGGGTIERALRHGIEPLLVKQFRSEVDAFFKAEHNKTRAAVTMGKTANEAKRQAKQGSFTPFLKAEFPYLDPRTLQRYMEIARFYDFTDYPVFCLAPLDHLKKIKDLYKFSITIAILEDNNVSLDVDPKNKEKVRIFRGHIKNLANGSMGFLNPSQDEKQAKLEAGPGGWTISNSLGDGTLPDTEIDTLQKADSTKIIPKQFLDFAELLLQFREDREERLDINDSQTLLKIATVIIKTIEALGPEKLKAKKLPNIYSYLKNILKQLDNIEIESGGDHDSESCDESTNEIGDDGYDCDYEND